MQPTDHPSLNPSSQASASRRKFLSTLATAIPAGAWAYGTLNCLSEPLWGRSISTLQSYRPSDAASFPDLNWQTDWPWWRGPLRNGEVCPASQLPTRFGPEQNVIWKAAIPGRGHSSPIIVGDQIYLTTSDEQKETQTILAVSRTRGEIVWQEQLNQGGFPENNHAKNTEATPTVACDGNLVFVTFFHHKAIHLTALTTSGKTAWTKRVGDFNPKRYEYGYAPSPVLYRNTVIVVGEHDGDSYLVAYSRKDGNEVWRIPRPNSISFSSPSIGPVAGKDQLMISGHEHVTSYDPQTGKQLWRVPGTTAATCGTVVWSDDIALASGGYPKSETIAIQATDTGKVLWRNGAKCYEQSMLVFTDTDSKDYLAALADTGIMYCWRVSDGKEMWKERLRGPVSASPILSGNNIYWANELGTMYVMRATAESSI